MRPKLSIQGACAAAAVQAYLVAEVHILGTSANVRGVPTLAVLHRQAPRTRSRTCITAPVACVRPGVPGRADGQLMRSNPGSIAAVMNRVRSAYTCRSPLFCCQTCCTEFLPRRLSAVSCPAAHERPRRPSGAMANAAWGCNTAVVATRRCL